MKRIYTFFSALLSFSAFSGVLIDDFSVAQPALTDTTTLGGGFQSSAAGGMLTGERDIFVELLTDDGGATVNSNIGVGGGVLEFNSTSGETGVGKVQWDGADAASLITAAAGSGILLDAITDDYTTGGATGFVFDVLFADAGFDVTFNLWSTVTGLTSATFVTAGTMVPVQSFLSFADPLFAGTDFTTIDAFELVINSGGATSIDLSLGGIETTGVPEPGTFALFSLAGLGLMWQRRKGSGNRAVLALST